MPRACLLSLLFALFFVLPQGCGPLDADPTSLGLGGKADAELPTAAEVLAAHANLELVVDSPHRRIDRVLFLAGTESIMPMQAQLMKLLPAEYFVVPSQEDGVTPAKYQAAIAAAGAEGRTVHIHENFHRRLTDWTQDRLFRFIDRRDGRSVVLPTRSDTVIMNENAGFELGVPLQLEALHPSRFAPLDDERFYERVVVASNDGSVHQDNATYSEHWYRGRIWNLQYGEGGDRFVTERFLFVGQSTYDKMLRQVRVRVNLEGMTAEGFLAALFNKTIIPVDAATQYERYSPHIDIYLTALDRGVDGRPTVVLGSPLSMLRDVFEVDDVEQLPEWVDAGWSWAKRVAAFERVRDQLAGLGFEIVEVPMLFIDLSTASESRKRTLTFNNGLLAELDGTPSFLAPDYAFPDRPEIAAAVTKAASIVKQRFGELGIDVKLVPGGEGSMHNQGELRCTTGVIGQSAGPWAS